MDRHRILVQTFPKDKSDSGDTQTSIERHHKAATLSRSQVWVGHRTIFAIIHIFVTYTHWDAEFT